MFQEVIGYPLAKVFQAFQPSLSIDLSILQNFYWGDWQPSGKTANKMGKI
jgi:hypothetical protein